MNTALSLIRTQMRMLPNKRHWEYPLHVNAEKRIEFEYCWLKKSNWFCCFSFIGYIRFSGGPCNICDMINEFDLDASKIKPQQQQAFKTERLCSNSPSNTNQTIYLWTILNHTHKQHHHHHHPPTTKIVKSQNRKTKHKKIQTNNFKFQTNTQVSKK